MVSNFETSSGDGGIAADPTWNIFDAGLWNGVETVGVNASSATGETRFELMKNFVDVEMRNGAGDLFVDYNGVQKITGLADTQNVTVSGMTAGALFVPGVETIVINSEISKSKLTGLNWTGAGAAVASNALETLKITGDQNLQIVDTIPWANAVNGKVIDGTVDASEASGNVKINVAGTTSTVSVTGGSGDDTINFAGTLTKNDVAEGGDGSDTILIDRIAAGLDEETAKVTGFEVFGFNTVASTSSEDSTINMDKLPSSIVSLQVDGYDNVQTGNNATFTLNNVPEGTSVIIKKTVADQVTNATKTDSSAGQGTEVIVNEKSDNDSNTLEITLDAVSSFSNAVGFGIDKINFANYETVTIHSDKNSAGTIKDNEVRTITATSTKTLTFDGAADLRISDLTTGSLGLSTVDATGLTGKFQIDDMSAGTAAALGTTYKLPNGKNTIALGSTLNNKDTITGGSHPTDSISFSANGLTATTGALNITDIETITATTGGANTFDLSGVTGASTFSVTENAQKFTNYDTGSKLVLEARGVSGSSNGTATFNVTAADSTGDSDTLYLRQDIANNANVSNTLTSTGIEILDLEVEDTQTSAANKSTWTLTKFDGTTINVTRGSDDIAEDTASVDLGLLHTNTVNVDTSDIKGTQAVNATNSKSAFTLNAGGGNTVTASSGEWDDTYTISKTSVAHSITGGDGTDSLTLTTTGSFTDPRNLTVEKLTFDVVPGDTVDLAQAFVATAGGPSTVTVKGGNSLSIFLNDTAGAEFSSRVTTVDASEFKGKVDLDFADNLLTDDVTISAGPLSTDIARVIYTTADATFKPKTTGVEKLMLTTTFGGSNTGTVNLNSTTGVTEIQAHVQAGDTFVIDKLDGQKIVVREGGASSVITAKLADDSGAEDTFEFEIKATGGGIDDSVELQLTDVETVTVESKGSAADRVSLAGLAMDAASKTLAVKVTGAKGLSTGATNADIDTIDASGMTEGGSYNQDPAGDGTGRSRTSSVTYTGSVGDDTFVMAHTDDVIDGGSQSAGTTGDMLRMSPVMELLIGGIVVDLTKSDDVVTTLNGLGNTAVQADFESVDLSLIQPGSFGSIITANKNGSTIVGLTGASTARNIINGGDGDDDITGGQAPDRIKPGIGNNTIRYVDAHVPANESLELTSTNTGTDTLVFGNTTDFTDVWNSLVGGGTFGAFAGLDEIQLADNVDLTMLASQLNGQTIDIKGTLAGGNNDTLIIEAPTATAALDYSGITPDANITSITINGHATDHDTITGTSGKDTIIAGAGNSTIMATSGIDTITGANGNDKFVMGATAANANNIADVVTTQDDIVLLRSGNTAGANAGALVAVGSKGDATIDDVITGQTAQLGENAVIVGNMSSTFTSGGYAWDVQALKLYYAADGDFRTGVELVSDVTAVSGGALVAGDFNFGLA